MEYRIGRAVFTLKMLGVLLQLPEGCEIEYVEQDFQGCKNNTFNVYLSGNSVPAAPDPCHVPDIELKYKSTDGKIRFSHIERIPKRV